MSWTAFIDGVEVTNVVTIIRARRLSRPSSVILTAQAEEVSVTVGVSHVTVWEDATLRFSGRAWFVKYQGSDVDATVEITAWDPMIYWPSRLVCDADGDFSLPDIITDWEYAPTIMSAALQNSIDGTDPGEVGGPIGMEVGVTDSTGALPLTGIPATWPMTLDEMRKLLVGTGQLDIVIDPNDDPDLMALANFYTQYGVDRSGSVLLQWGTGLFNVETIERTVDMSVVCNRLWTFLGPKCDDEQHWNGNITRDDSTLPGNSGSIYGGIGGEPTTPLGDRIDDSRDKYFALMQAHFFDTLDTNGCLPANALLDNSYRVMYQLIWQNESWLRAEPRNLVTWTPVDDYVVVFDVGDLVTVEAGARLGGGFSGVQRIYEFTQTIDVNGTVSTAVVTSEDQEGATG